MTIEKIKNNLSNHMGEKAVIKYNLGRNKIEEYNVIIKELYKHVFLVKLTSNEIKSFSYTDIITNTIKIKF